MTEQTSSPQPQLADDDKLTATMFYTANSMIWGKVLSKKPIRVSTWLLTDMAPNYLTVYDSQVVIVGGQKPVSLKFPVLYLQLHNISAYHLIPPASEPPDYDASEPNRKMVPTIALIDQFRFDGLTRMAAFSNPRNYLSAAKAEFVPLYDAHMTCPLVPSIKGVQTPMVLLRQQRVMFAMEDSPAS